VKTNPGAGWPDKFIYLKYSIYLVVFIILWRFYITDKTCLSGPLRDYEVCAASACNKKDLDEAWRRLPGRMKRAGMHAGNTPPRQENERLKSNT
jgi:hypothetical protein